MGASNSESANAKFYKLKEDKIDNSPSKGELRFFEQEKLGSSWHDGKSFNKFSGTLVSVEVREFEYEGKKKESLQLKFKDGEGVDYVSMGFDSMTARSILNTLAGELIYGNLRFECGKPKEINGKSYPTLYVKNDGHQTNWKFSKANNNLDLIPKVTTTVDDDGNSIKVGVKKSNEFWKNVIKTDILPKLAHFNESPKAASQVATATASTAIVTDDDLPF